MRPVRVGSGPASEVTSSLLAMSCTCSGLLFHETGLAHRRPFGCHASRIHQPTLLDLLDPDGFLPRGLHDVGVLQLQVSSFEVLCTLFLQGFDH